LYEWRVIRPERENTSIDRRNPYPLLQLSGFQLAC